MSRKLPCKALAIACAAVALPTLALSGNQVFAAQCGETYQTEDDSDYFYLEKTLLDDSTINQVRNFADKLDGRWQGSGLEIRCGVSNDEPHTTINNYDVDAEINRHFLGALVLEVQQESEDLVNLDRVYLSPETEADGQGQKTGHRNYSVDTSQSNALVFDEKYHTFTSRTVQGSQRSAVRLVHEIKTVSFNEVADTITVNRDVYVNGKFSTQQAWELTRR